MHLPLIHRHILGVVPISEGVSWVCLTVVFQRVVRATWGTLPCTDADRLSAVAALMQEHGWQHAEVVVGLDPMYVRHRIVETPAADSEEAFDAWIRDEVVAMLPVGADVAAFLWRCRVVQYDDEGLRCMVGIARKDRVEMEVARMREAGLVPIALSGGVSDLEGVWAGWFTEERYGYAAACDGDDVLCFAYDEGTLTRFIRLAGAGSTESARWDAVLSTLAEWHSVAEPGRLVPAMEGIKIPATDLEAMHVSTKPWVWTLAGTALPASQVSAGAVAWGHVQGGDAMNFLDATDVKAHVQAVEKPQALRVILASGGVVAVLLALVLVLQLWVTQRVTESEEALMTMAHQIEVLNGHRETVQGLEGTLREAGQFMDARTEAAVLLATIGKSLPPGVWLDACDVARDKQQRWQIELKGAAIEEQGVAEWLGRLERLPDVENVELVVSEKTQARRRYKKDRLRDVDVTRFHIVVHFPPSLANGEG